MKRKQNDFVKEIKKRKAIKRFFKREFGDIAGRDLFKRFLENKKILSKQTRKFNAINNRKRKKFIALENIPFGRAVVLDKNGIGVRLPKSGKEKILGVTMELRPENQSNVYVSMGYKI